MSDLIEVTPLIPDESYSYSIQEGNLIFTFLRFGTRYTKQIQEVNNFVSTHYSSSFEEFEFNRNKP